jgi:hypothetical protein
MNIYAKLIEVRKAVQYLKKENKGAQYNYVSSSQTLASVKAKMDDLGLLLIPRVIGKEVRESINGKGATVYFTELIMEYTWINAEDPNETITSPWYGQGIDTAGEKGVGKALTYAEKYFMLKFFNIPTDKDDPDAFQKKNEDGDTKQLAAVDKLTQGIDWFDTNGKPVEKMIEWFDNPTTKALKKELDADNLSKINKYFGQMVDVMTEKKAA